jgi:dTDP-4-dehydrorhamnose 3,5-epimerase
MIVRPTALPGCLLLEPRLFRDDRGSFQETWQRARYLAAGLPGDWAQDNLSRTHGGVLRGLHYQLPPQGKLVSVVDGEIYDVAVDVRRGSPTFGQSVGVHLSGESGGQFYVPPGFAHGFCVLSEVALVAYKCTVPYHPEGEVCVRFDDPALGISWPVATPRLSPKDAAGLRLAEVPAERLPTYAP